MRTQSQELMSRCDVTQPSPVPRWRASFQPPWLCMEICCHGLQRYSTSLAHLWLWRDSPRCLKNIRGCGATDLLVEPAARIVSVGSNFGRKAFKLIAPVASGREGFW